MSKLDALRQAKTTLPESYKAWQVFGAGLENVGKDRKPVSVPLRAPNANEVLLRVDALGLCLSDMKIIAQGGNHPRLRGRDLQKDPTVLGHECAATIVAVGDDWKNAFKTGQRFIVQADIYYKGVGYAFGYMIPGGLAEYAYLDERGLNGDEGCYLLPVRETTGYSEAALSEPGLCRDVLCPEGPRGTHRRKQLIVSWIAAPVKNVFPTPRLSPRFKAFLKKHSTILSLSHPTPALVEPWRTSKSQWRYVFVGAPAKMVTP